MSTAISLEEAQARLSEFIAQLVPGEEVIITAQGHPLARLKRSERNQWPCRPGTAKGTKYWMVPDFDAPLDDFREYME
jgi:antitoxin (DNA-binding transcriptional repressor) of toxin-antitoxin stability system